MSRTQPPRDAIAATDLWVPVDATGDDFYALGSRFGTQVGVLHELHEESGAPYAKPEGAGFLDPWGLRWHRLQRQVSEGVDDNRLAFQVVNDYEGPYVDVRDGDAPFGQRELFTSLNRTTREADLQGRVALPSSHRRIIDSEDGRYALALTCRSVPLSAAELPDAPVDVEDLGPTGVPAGVVFRDAGVTTGSHGSVTQGQPSVSINGVTYFGQGAVDAARDALAAGGGASDAGAWASAAAFGGTRPKIEGGGGDVATRERTAPPPPDDNPTGGGVPLLDHPAGYVWSKAGVVGLLGTLVCPEGAGGNYFKGREDTPIGPLPLRHDAQVTMGPDLVGRMVFVRDDAAEVSEGTGKPIKGELWADTSRANQDTELGLETLQWRPVVRVNADLPPSRPPPHDPPPWVDPRRKEEEDGEEEDEDDDEEGGGQPPPGGGGGRRPPPGRGPGESSGEDEGDGTFVRVPTGTFIPVPRKPEGGSGDGDPGLVAQPGSQVRDYEGPGEPCPNTTAGVLHPIDGGGALTATPLRVPTTGGLPVIGGPGGWIQYSGHPALSLVEGGIVVGGVDAGISLGLPTPPGAGVDVWPAPNNDDGVRHGRRVPGDQPGRIPLGLPAGDGSVGGFGFSPPLGGDRGVPHGAAERAERRAREERVRRVREAQDKRERDAIDKLKQLEERARDEGRERTADRIRRARERQERRRAERQERQRKKEEAKQRRREEREARRKAREQKKAEEELQRRIDRALRRRRDRERRERGPRRPPQGGYMIDVTEGEAVAVPAGLPDDGRRLLEEDRERERRRREREAAGAFGDWNVMNRPLPFFGSPGGPRSLEGWAHLATYAVQALQRVTNGAFGGPSYLAGNLGVVHRNRPDNPPAGSRIGGHWTVPPGESDLQVCEGEAPLEVVSVLDAPAGTKLCACAGAVLRVVREHRGDGQLDDFRPLILLENERSTRPGTVRADLIADLERRFYVTHARRLTAAGLAAYVVAGERESALEVARIDPETRTVAERYVDVGPDGVLAVHKGARVEGGVWLSRGGVLSVSAEGGDFTIRGSEEGLVISRVSEGPSVSLVLGPKALTVTGDLRVSGKVFSSS